MNDKDLSIIKKSWYKIGIILKYNYIKMYFNLKLDLKEWFLWEKFLV